MDRSWVLLGMMGVGKSAVGRALAEASGRTYVDTDMLLQNRFGRTVTKIFAAYGEDTFRDHETSILKTLSPDAAVVATGGGIVMREANWIEMRRLGLTIYLEATAETLINHLEKGAHKRPLLQTENWQDRLEALLEQRKDLYRQADFCLRVDSLTISEAAEQAKALLESA